MPRKLRQHLSWIIPALLTVTSFAGGLATEWIASDLQPRIKNRVWIAYLIAVVCTIITVIFAVRTARKLKAANSGSIRKTSIGGNVTGSAVITGDRNTLTHPSKDR